LSLAYAFGNIDVERSFLRLRPTVRADLDVAERKLAGIALIGVA